MDTTLVVNPGSASKKYAFFKGGTCALSVLFERTAEGFGKCFEIDGVRQECEASDATAFDEALSGALAVAKEKGVLQSEKDVTRVALRVVAPGTFFLEHRKIDDVYKKKLETMRRAAPLHIPPTLDELAVIQELLPHATVVGASDSAYHSTIPSHARTYSIPTADATKYDLYRYGYHGLSISSVSRAVPLLLDEMPERMVVCHIGSGVSIAAVKNGASLDTSMGFTPASGLMMGTRAGDIDPGALIYLLEMKDLDDGEAHAFIQKEGGLKGLLGTSDLRIALDRAAKGDPKAEEAVRMYFYDIKKEIGASVAALGGIDVLVLTATAPERNPYVRTLVCSGLEGLGILVDEVKNDALVGKEGVISATNSRVTILVMKTDEMGEMARIASRF